LPGYINHDLAQLPGIDCTHDLNNYPWPWDDESFDEVSAIDVLEDLDNFTCAMEELHRVLKIGGSVAIRVPYWNSWCAYADPTHKKGFHEITIFQ
jgi:predicted SAM-dependent methyltransferase